jgi:hypothetical protein
MIATFYTTIGYLQAVTTFILFVRELRIAMERCSPRKENARVLLRHGRNLRKTARFRLGSHALRRALAAELLSLTLPNGHERRVT